MGTGNKLRVLVACEFSGVVRDAFIKRGHDAMSCDLLPTERRGPHHQGDVLEILNDGWDLIIAHPPCTYISIASACRMYPKKGILDQERYKMGLLAKDFFMLFYNSSCPKVAIENPVSLSILNMPPYSQEIQPWQFGHPYSKKTRLWLKGLDGLNPTNIVTEGVVSWVNAGSKDANGNPRKKLGKCHTTKDRNKTFQGIASAMAEQWGNHLLPENMEQTSLNF